MHGVAVGVGMEVAAGRVISAGRAVGVSGGRVVGARVEVDAWVAGRLVVVRAFAAVGEALGEPHAVKTSIIKNKKDNLGEYMMDRHAESAKQFSTLFGV